MARRLGIPVAVAVSALVVASAAQATTPTTCGTLQSDIDVATNGEVLQLPPGPCATNLTVNNPASFTLEGTSPGTTLTPSAASTPIVTGSKPASGGLSFTLADLTFTGMNGGSAISITDPGEAVTLSGDTFVGNTDPTGTGVAVLIEPSAAATATQPTVLDHNTFGAVGEGNSSGDGSGGAVAVWGSLAPLQITNNTFVANSANGGFGLGGGLIVFNYTAGGTDPVTVSGNTFGGSAPGAGNTAGDAGGGAYIELPHGQPLTLDANHFIDNAISGVHTAENPRTGAGLTVALNQGEDTGFQVSQAHNVFSGNVINETAASGHTTLPAAGAGEWVYGVTVHSTADVFDGNQITVNDGAPPEGGGLGVLGEPAQSAIAAQPGTFVGVDDTFLGNSVAAGGWGGAIYSGIAPPYCSSGCPGSSVTLDDSTVSGNSVSAGAGSEGGAIWGSPGDSLTVNNSIIFDNAPQPEIHGYLSPTFAFSDVCNESGGPTVSGPGLICADPLLNADGSETAAGPTIDAGSNALVAAGLATDVAGNPRITAGRCGDAAIVDMGAFEYPAATCPRPPPPRSTMATVGNQRITLVTPSLLTCTANTNKLAVTLESTRTAKSKGAKLKFSSAAFYIGKGVKHTRHKMVRTRKGKKKKELVTFYAPNATAHHVPVTVDLSLKGMRAGTHTLKVVVSYKETKRKHGHKKTVTVTKTLNVKFSIC